PIINRMGTLKSGKTWTGLKLGPSPTDGVWMPHYAVHVDKLRNPLNSPSRLRCGVLSCSRFQKSSHAPHNLIWSLNEAEMVGVTQFHDLGVFRLCLESVNLRSLPGFHQLPCFFRLLSIGRRGLAHEFVQLMICKKRQGRHC